MKTYIIVLFVSFFSMAMCAQSIIGAWESYSTSENGEPLKSVVIFADGYQVASTFNAKTGTFIHTNGGSWKLNGDEMTETIEFDTSKPELVGTQTTFKVNISDNTIQIVDSGLKFTRIDDGTPGKLQGAWLMSGRIRNGETQLRDTNRPRKTMKILSGTRFQWIAYNTETKEFKGTGGGTYTTENGAYTEHIEFFSRDDSKVGISLKFKFELMDGTWHNSGLSSKGEPIHELWIVRE